MTNKTHIPWQEGKDVVSSTINTVDELISVIIPYRSAANTYATPLGPSTACVGIVDGVINRMMGENDG